MSMVGRLVLALLVVACGVGPGIFLMILFGANSRTVTVVVGLVAGVVLLAGGVDAALREMGKAPGTEDGSYSRRMKVVIVVAGVLLVGAIVVFLGLVAVAMARSLK
jgi:hypothetical protein